MKNKILFNGYYGYGNTGDNAFVEVAVWGAKKFWNINNNLIHTAIVDPKYLPKINNSAYFYHIKRFRGQYRIEINYHIFTTKYFVTAGGSVLTHKFDKENIKLIGLKRKRQNKEILCGAIGVSLGPFKDVANEEFIKSYLQKLDFLTLRDSASFQIAESFNLPYKPIHSFDLAALLPEIYKDKFIENKIYNKKIIGISLCNYERYIENKNIENENRRNKTMIDLLIQLAKLENVFIRFFIFNGNQDSGDELITQEAVKELQQRNLYNFEILPYYSNPIFAWKKIKECNVMIATRLHAAIFACFAQVPFFLNEYHRKCTDFLNDIGQSDKYIIGDADFDINNFLIIIQQILYDKKIILPFNINEMIDRSKLNFESIKQFFHA